jgi:hypothetical protein
MSPRDALMRRGPFRWAGVPLLLAVLALLAAPLAWAAVPSELGSADGICRADGGAGHAGAEHGPEKSSHRHDGCSVCQIGVGLDLLAGTSPALPGASWLFIVLPLAETPVVTHARFPAYTSRAPPQPVGA